jgi:hypothetical protein
MIEKPTNVISAILKRHMRYSSVAKRNSPSYDTVLHGRCHHERSGEITISMYGPEVKSAAPIRSRFIWF